MGVSYVGGCSKDIGVIDDTPGETADTSFYRGARVHTPDIGWRARVRVRAEQESDEHTR